MKLILLQYKNYFNRSAKKLTTLNDYFNAVGENYLIVDDFDFNPADGVDTKIVIGGEYYDYQTSNYLLVVDGQTIDSRWYIMEADRTRNGQYRLTIHRDVIADYWDIIKVAPGYIEKATVADGSPLIWNSEGFACNQIKQGRRTITDDTGIAWIVGYINRDTEETPITSTAVSVADMSYASKEDFQNAKLSGLEADVYWKSLHTRKYYFTAFIAQGSMQYDVYKLTCDLDAISTSAWSYEYVEELNELPSSGLRLLDSQNIDNFVAYLNSTTASSIFAELVSREPTDVTDYTYYNLTNYNTMARKGPSVNNKILQLTDSDVGYYQCSYQTQTNYLNLYESSYMASYISNFLINHSWARGGVPTESQFARTSNQDRLYLNPSPSGSYGCTIPAPNSRMHLKDAPYDMFICPFGEISIRNSLVSGWTNISISSKYSLQICQEIAEQLGTNLLDLQILPWCPITGYTMGSGYMDIKSSVASRYTIVTDNNDNPRSILLWATASSGSFTASYPTPTINLKIANETDKYRLVSPNGSSQFEINPSKNRGLSGFNCYFTYIPYSPYMQVQPIYSGLYGDNYTDDYRGLICQGDFSVAYMSDAWVNYVNNNKNYAEIFERDLQNMEVQHKWQMVDSAVSAVSGAVGAGTFLAGMTGPIGGVIGGAVSAGAGAIDLYAQQKLYNESVSYAKDKYNYSLQNIQAMPDSVRKSTSYTINNPLFPTVEYYTCTDEEKEALANKIRFEGMTVGLAGRIIDYIDNSWSYGSISDWGFIRMTPYKLDIGDDFHLASVITQELQKGVYTK